MPDEFHLRFAEKHTQRRLEEKLVANKSPDVELLADFGLRLMEQLFVFSCLGPIETAAEAVQVQVTPWLDRFAGAFADFLVIIAGVLTVQTDHEDDLDGILLERIDHS